MTDNETVTTPVQDPTPTPEVPITSILNSIKKEFLGIEPEYTHFDGNIILLINSQLGVLNQRGVGPTNPFKITGATETWSQFFENKNYMEMAKELIGLKVKLTFDPPQQTNLIQAFSERANELEWRLQIFDDDSGDQEDSEDE